MFEFQQNTLCVAASWLYSSEIMSEGNYKWLCSKGKIKKIQTGGNGRRALVAYESIPDKFKKKIREIAGDPYEKVKNIVFADYIEWDHDAEAFYKAYRLADGSELPEEKQTEYIHQAMMFNAVTHITTNVVVQRKFGGKSKMWQRIVEALQNLPETWLHTRYKNVVSFKRAYKKYIDESYGSIVSGKFLNENSTKLQGDSAKWLLAQYCLPIKYTVPELVDIYNSIREEKGWKSITERAVNSWLQKPEQKRIWFLARHGREEYMKVYGHTLMRDREEWFPNAYWAIDGTKLDLVHYAPNGRKMAAELKINVLVDVYSEKIIGWDLAFSEDHASHFKALKMAVNNSGCRPYLFTYDKQSGHTSKRMQELYDRLPAKGGTHYSHKAGRKTGAPVEQIFNRFQQQVVSKMWFSDKQSIKVRKLDNKPNTDFLVEYKDALPTTEEMYKVVEALVNRWNSMKQRGWAISRNERYLEDAPKREEIDTLDMISMFWIDEKPIKYRAHGLETTIAGNDYVFEVYDENNEIDLEFRRKYVGEKVIVRYDPEYLNEMAALYEETANGEKRFIAHALPKRKHQEIPALMKEGAKAIWEKDMRVPELEFKRDSEAYERLMRETGITPEKLIQDQELFVKMQGKMPKEVQADTESKSFYSKL